MRDRIVSNASFGSFDQLRTEFETREQDLAHLFAQLSTRDAESQAIDASTAAEGGSSAQLIVGLQDVCQKTLSAIREVREQRTGQRFGDINTDENSTAMRGVVGEVQPGVDQSFGSMTATNNSRAFQGQMDASSFAKFFGR